MLPISSTPPYEGQTALEIPALELQRAKLSTFKRGWITVSECNYDILERSYHFDTRQKPRGKFSGIFLRKSAKPSRPSSPQEARASTEPGRRTPWHSPLKRRSRPSPQREMERRCKMVRSAQRSNANAGVRPDPAAQPIFDAFIAGEIEVDELMHRIKALYDVKAIERFRPSQAPPVTAWDGVHMATTEPGQAAALAAQPGRTS